MVAYELKRLEAGSVIEGFDCGNEDINGFLAEDARDYQDGLMAVTYLAVGSEDKDLVAYFCLLNDKLAYLPGDDKKAWNRLNRKVNNRTGCRFLTVDAHRDAIGLYEKCGFSFFTESDRDEETRLMYFDLKLFSDALKNG